MIPKKIHYCWFGGKPLPELAIRCIDSWRKLLPDYEIIEWNETNFDIHICKYVEEAYNARKWAFVADYARFLALYNEGGIYFDTDIEVLKSFDDLLQFNAFFGYGQRSLTLPVFGAKAQQGLYKQILEFYNTRSFIKPDGTYDTTTIEVTARKVLEENYGFTLNWKQQILRDNIAILPQEYFGSTDFLTGKISKNPNLYVIHYADGSWLSDEERMSINIHRKYVNIMGEKIGMLIGDIVYLYHRYGARKLMNKIIYKVIYKKNG